MYFSFFIVFASFSSFIFASNEHITRTHFYNKYYNYIDKLVNENTNVFSAITRDKNNKVYDRKTFFSKEMQDRPDFKSTLDHIINQQHSEFIHAQHGNSQNRRVEYKQDILGKYMIAVVVNDSNSVSTAYPVLRFISAAELQGKKDTDQIYLVTKADATGHKFVKITASVKTIKDASRDGVYLGLKKDNNNMMSYLVDISKNFPTLFNEASVERGSITVQTDWINKR